MKKSRRLLAVLAIASIAQAGYAADGKVTIKANVTNLGDTVVVFSPDGNGRDKRDTVVLKNNQFTAEIAMSQPGNMVILPMATLRKQSNVQLRLVGVPGEEMVLTGDATKNVQLSGTKFYTDYNKAIDYTEEARQPLTALVDSLTKLMQGGQPQAAVMKIYNEKAPALEKVANKKILDYIKQHNDEDAAAAVVVSLPEEDLQAGVALLSEGVRNGRMKPFYQQYLDMYAKQREAEAAAEKAQAAGVVAPDFTLNDINGKPLSLSSLKGKYVLLDFWGTWCIWCVRGIPKMKEYYAKYKDKFEILSIDCNESEDKWKAGVKKHELPWLHVYQPKAGAVQTTQLYAIQGFPTKILVGPDGKIVKTIVGEDPAFYTFMDETFGK